MSLSPLARRRLEVEALEDRALPSITIQFDFSHDSTGFFSVPAHLQALQAAANDLTARLGDSLAAIVPNPAAGNTWVASFTDPATGTVTNIPNMTVPANTIIVFAGGRAVAPGSAELGVGGPGGFSARGAQTFINTVAGRGQAGALGPDAQQTDFGPWGGSVTFDSSPSTNWYFGLDPSGLQRNQEDFLSVAEHELSHLLGFGTAASWENRVVGSSFTGPASQAEFGGSVPTDAPAPNAGHWADNTMNNGARACMDPTLPSGVRATFTQLDFAGLADLGWQVSGLGIAVNQPPIAPDVLLSDLPANTTFTIPVSALLANDQPGPPSEAGQTLTIVAVFNAVGGTVALVGNNIIFTPTPNTFGPASFMYTVTDNGTTGGLPDAKIAQATVSFNVVPPATTVTVAPPPAAPVQRSAVPTLSAPHHLTTHHNTPLFFTGNNRITVSDRTTSASVRLTLTAVHGTLRLHGPRGLRAAKGAVQVTLTGTLALVNRALIGLAFMPQNDFTGAAHVKLAATAPGHAARAMSVIAITVRR